MTPHVRGVREHRKHAQTFYLFRRRLGFDYCHSQDLTERQRGKIVQVFFSFLVSKLTLTEAVLVAAGEVLHVPHPAGASGPPPQGLLAPVVC